MRKKYLSIEEAGKHLGVPSDEIEALIDEGLLRAYRLEGETVFKNEHVGKLAAELGVSNDRQDNAGPDAGSANLFFGKEGETVGSDGQDNARPDAGPAKLFFGKEGKTVVIPIDQDEFIFGRSPESDVRLLKDSKLSRKHCSIIRRGKAHFIRDLGSSNGTFVNDNRIIEEAELNDGDVLKIGEQKFVFQGNEEGDMPEQSSDLVFCKVCRGRIAAEELAVEEVEESGICPDCLKGGHRPSLGNYEILEKIAQGGMGVVYLARHKVLNTKVAVKFLRASREGGDRGIRRFVREVKLGAMIDHPNICKFYDAGQEGDLYYLIMEYLSGPTLLDLCEEGKPLPIGQACEYAYQLVDALKTFADAQIVHRDIKPSNIIVNDSGQIKVLDFGIAKDIESTNKITNAGQIMGSPISMAPEQVQGEEVDSSTDLYAAGATLYRLITGRNPFQAESPIKVMYKVVHDEPEDPLSFRPDLPEDLVEIVLTLMSKDRDKRPLHAEVLRVLDTFRQAEPVEETGESEAEEESSQALVLDEYELQSHVDEIEENIEEQKIPELLDVLPQKDDAPCLGNYCLEQRLGEQTTIQTFRARHVFTGTPFVLRVLPPSFCQMEPDRLAGLRRSQGDLMRISDESPFLASLRDVGEEECTDGRGSVYFMAEMQVEGGTLLQSIESGSPLSANTISECLSQAVQGLDALHDKGFLHGNLHPGKLYFNPDSKRCLVTDFSWSYAADHVGTDMVSETAFIHQINDVNWASEQTANWRQYIAPEVLSENARHDPLTEQYALGVIFIEAALARSVRTHPNDLQLLTYARMDIEEYLEEIADDSPGMAKVLRRMVSMNPIRRYAGSQAIIQDIEDAVSRKNLQTARQQRSSSDSYDVFISYRRDGGSETARSIQQALEKHGYTVFLDVDSLSSGQFDESLLTTIKLTPNFLVVLSPDSLGRCNNPGDWFMAEISHALKTERNIIPCFDRNFRKPADADLSPELVKLLGYQGVKYDHEFFQSVMQRLESYLKK